MPDRYLVYYTVYDDMGRGEDCILDGEYEELVYAVQAAYATARKAEYARCYMKKVIEYQTGRELLIPALDPEDCCMYEPLKQIVIYMNKGLIDRFVSSFPIDEVIIVDNDVEGVEDEEIYILNGEPVVMDEPDFFNNIAETRAVAKVYHHD